MANKPIETTSENPNPSISPSSEDVFNYLSGGIRQEPHNPISVSIFSDFGPSPKKHIDDSRSIPEKLKQVLRLDAHGPQKCDSQIAESSDDNSNKRKRKENLPDSFDSNDSDVEREIKKSKREIGLVSESSILDHVKKKRKRIEVEAEHEEGKYGKMDLDLKQVKGEKLKIGKKRKYLDSGEDLIVTEEGSDDEEMLLRTIFVGNLPWKVKKKALLRNFGQFGEIESIQTRTVPLLNDKTPIKGAVIKKQLNDAVNRVNVNAYIVFKTEESAQASLSCNMAVLGENPIHVERACPPWKKLKGEKTQLYDSKRTVYIANLPFDVKDEELYQLFTGISNLKDSIEAIWVVRDPATSMGKGIAYALFKTRVAANTVVGKRTLKIRDRELILSRVIKTNPILSKRKEPPSDDDYNKSNKKLSMGVGTSYQGYRGSC